MSVFLIAGAAVAVGGGIFKAISGGKAAKAARKEAEAAKKELAASKDAFSKVDTSNPFADAKNEFAGLENKFADQKNMYKDMENKFEGMENSYDDMKNSYDDVENAYEDLTVDTKAAEFEAKQNEATQANILSSMAGAAGGSGIAALAQSMANQGAINASKSAASIGQQESANQKLAAGEESKIQMAQAEEQGSIDKAKAAEQGRLDSLEAQGAADVQKTILGEDAAMQQRELSEASRLQTQEAQGAMDVQKMKGEGDMWSSQQEMAKHGKLMDMSAQEMESARQRQSQGKKDMFSGIGSIASGLGGFSDIRMKENIVEIGTSPSGIPIYTFNYKGNNKKWSGTMAQDLIGLEKYNAVFVAENGYYAVDYSKIDVEMLSLN
tara:strand:+ start:1290 stop:2432 length:1143 start_codon:yes stop_codon:yes gene_type:complete